MNAEPMGAEGRQQVQVVGFSRDARGGSGLGARHFEHRPQAGAVHQGGTRLSLALGHLVIASVVVLIIAPALPYAPDQPGAAAPGLDPTA